MTSILGRQPRMGIQVQRLRDQRIVSFVGVTMQASATTCLDLLAPDGIVRVTFAASPNGDQCLALLNVSQTAKTAGELAKALEELGTAWGVDTQTEILSRVRRAVRVS